MPGNTDRDLGIVGWGLFCQAQLCVFVCVSVDFISSKATGHTNKKIDMTDFHTIIKVTKRLMAP